MYAADQMLKERASGGLAGGANAQVDPRFLQGQNIAPERTPDVPAALQSAHERMDALYENIAILRKRLDAILRQEPNKASSQGAPPYGGCTAVSSRIAELTNKIEAALFDVRQMADLLEL